MFGPLGIWEIMLIVLAVVVLFGAKRLPELGAGIGKGITNFRKAIKGQDDEAGRIEEKKESADKDEKEGEKTTS